MLKWSYSARVLAALLAVTAAPLASAQSCALCYTQAASATQQFIQALRSGILILVIPPVIMWTIALIVVYRRRNKFRMKETTGAYSGW